MTGFAGILETARSRARTAGRAEGGPPFPSAGFFTLGGHSGDGTVIFTQFGFFLF